MTFINNKRCHQFMLEYAAKNKVHKFTRVSQETLIKLDDIVRNAMIGHVKHMPSKGKTL